MLKTLLLTILFAVRPRFVIIEQVGSQDS